MVAPAPRLAALLRRVEAAGVRATERHWALMPAEAARHLRPQVARVGDGLSTLLRTSDALRVNRVIGLGHAGDAKATMIDDLIARYRTAGLKRFSVQLGPGPQMEQIAGWLKARGFARHGGTLLLLRDLRRPIPRVSSALRVSRATRVDHEAILRIHGEAFALPASRSAWSLAALRTRESETFVARDGRTPVAVGTLRVDGRLAWLGGGATRTSWRRSGAHAAIIAARLRRAVSVRCRWAWAETGIPTPGRPDGSRRNLVRLGFEPVCVKPVFLWSEG